MDVRLKGPQRFRALLVDADQGRHRFLRSLLEDRGFVVVHSFANVGELQAAPTAAGADLLILYAENLEQSTCADIRSAKQARPQPILLISECDTPDDVALAIEAGADAILPIGVTADRFRCAAHSAMATFTRAQVADQQIVDLRRELEHRKLIERAKGILMTQRRISEQDAFREIQQRSMECNIPMPEVARSIIAAKELLG
jgi:two-component system, response regulator / RNA-binding antiterminator